MSHSLFQWLFHITFNQSLNWSKSSVKECVGMKVKKEITRESGRNEYGRERKRERRWEEGERIEKGRRPEVAPENENEKERLPVGSWFVIDFLFKKRGRREWRILHSLRLWLVLQLLLSLSVEQKRKKREMVWFEKSFSFNVHFSAVPKNDTAKNVSPMRQKRKWEKQREREIDR